MKATSTFINIISDFLNKEGANDHDFAKKMAEHPEKTPEAACNFIMAKVSKTKQSGWADEEIYGMARHFIDEAELKDPGINNSVSRVVVNSHIDLTEEQKQLAMEQAKRDYEQKLEQEHKKELEAQVERERAKAEKKRKLIEERQKSVYATDLFGNQY